MTSLSETTQDQAKWPRETHSVTYAPGLTTLSNISRIVTQPPPSLLCFPKATFRTSIQPNLGLSRNPSPPTSPSSPFWPYGTHPFFSHHRNTLWSVLIANSLSTCQTIAILSNPLSSLTPFPPALTISILSDPLYSLTPFLFQLSYTHYLNHLFI